MPAGRQLWIPKKIPREAYEWRGRLSDLPAGWRTSGAFLPSRDGSLVIDSDGGPVRAETGDFVTQDVAGDFYRIKRAKFLATYDKADD